VQITHQVIWPLYLLPLALINQIFTPHPVWLVLFVMLLGMYGSAYYWVRSQARAVEVTRKRQGAILVAGDSLHEEFALRNESVLPVLWAEFIDHSNLPGYQPGRVLGCGAGTTYRWQSKVECKQRGVYQLGPHELRLGDPLGLFRLEMRYDEREIVLIYPRVARLPIVALPYGNASGTARQRRPSWGALPSAGVREYQATDSLRYVHWPLTARRGELVVKELEIEPSGAVWIVLDLNQTAHWRDGERDSLEFSVIIAASLAAELLTGSDQRAVGFYTLSGSGDPAQVEPVAAPHAVHLLPQRGQAQLWRILAALAPVQATDVPLLDLLRSCPETLGRRGTVILITPQLEASPTTADWSAELLHLQAVGLASSVILIGDGERAGAHEAASGQLRSLLARYDIPVQMLPVGLRLPAALTFRRTRKVIRNTPRGGVVTYEVEEEVG